MQLRRLVPFSIATLCLAVAGCGGDDGDPSEAGGDVSGADSVVEVLAEDIRFPQDVYETEAGAVGFVYENAGNIRHTLVIEGQDGLDLEVNRNGDVDQGVIDLESGSYTLVCDVPGHEPAGMVAELIVD